MKLELCFANYLCTNPQYNNVKKIFFEYISSLEYIKQLEVILKFLEESKSNIPKGIKRYIYDDGDYELDFFADKSKRRTLFISDMIKEKVIDCYFSSYIFKTEEFSLEDINDVFLRQGLINRKQLFDTLKNKGTYKTKEGEITFETDQDVLDYYLTRNESYYFSIATVEEIIRDLVAGKFKSTNKAFNKISIGEFATLNSELIEAFFSMERLPKKFVSNGFIDKNIMQGLSRESLLRILYSKKIRYKNPLTSDNLVDLYGKLTLGKFSSEWVGRR